MNKVLKKIVSFALIANMASMFAMVDPMEMLQGMMGQEKIQDIGRDMANAAQQIGNGIDYEIRLRREELARQRADLEERARAGDEYAQADLAAVREQERQWDNLGVNLTGQFAQAGLNMMQAPIQMFRDQMQAANNLRQVAVQTGINARAQAENNLAMLREKLNWIKEPKNVATLVGGAAGITLGIYGMYHLTSLMADYVRHLYRNPTLAQETSLLSFGEKLKALFVSAANVSKKVSDVILTPELEAEIAHVKTAIQQANKTNDYLPNILFYGPPGTGKTMLAVRLARASKMDYLIISASALDQYSIEEALIKLTELFEFAKKSGKKLMIVIDEVERLFCKRRPDMPEKTAKMLTHLLSYVGTETSDFMVVGLTNMPDMLDKAYLSRCDYRIEIQAPNEPQRYRIIKKYAQDYLFKAPMPTRKPKLFGSIFGVKKPVRITVAKDAMNDAKMHEIARMTKDFVGRDLSKMIFEMRRRATITKSKTLTQQIVDEVVTRKINEKNNEKQGFKDYLK